MKNGPRGAGSGMGSEGKSGFGGLMDVGYLIRRLGLRNSGGMMGYDMHRRVWFFDLENVRGGLRRRRRRFELATWLDWNVLRLGVLYLSLIRY